ncbi:MAG: hypothetical protein EB116_06720 [Betaproteobacteria bacterium]|nr:hypothetical protein [Betaproteobacteria bacterium]
MRFQANEWTARSLPLMTWIEHGGVYVIAHDKHFDLLALVEDELLLALPIVPKHLQCEPPGTSQAVAPLQSNRPKPFAVLSSLKSITDDDKRSED